MIINAAYAIKCIQEEKEQILEQKALLEQARKARRRAERAPQVFVPREWGLQSLAQKLSHVFAGI